MDLEANLAAVANEVQSRREVAKDDWEEGLEEGAEGVLFQVERELDFGHVDGVTIPNRVRKVLNRGACVDGVVAPTSV